MCRCHCGGWTLQAFLMGQLENVGSNNSLAQRHSHEEKKIFLPKIYFLLLLFPHTFLVCLVILRLSVSCDVSLAESTNNVLSKNSSICRKCIYCWGYETTTTTTTTRKKKQKENKPRKMVEEKQKRGENSVALFYSGHGTMIGVGKQLLVL